MKDLQTVFLQLLLGLSATAQWASVDQGCRPTADVIFLLDGSDSISESEFTEQKDFISRFVEMSDVGADTIRVGIAVVSSIVGDMLPLAANMSKQHVLLAVSNLSQPQEGSRTDIGLMEMEQLFAVQGRRGVLKIGVVLTDGRAKFEQAAENEAQFAKTSGIFLIAIGVGRLIKTTTLEKIASTTSNAYPLQPINLSTKLLHETVSFLGQESCAGHMLLNQLSNDQMSAKNTAVLDNTISNALVNTIKAVLNLSKMKNKETLRNRNVLPEKGNRELDIVKALQKEKLAQPQANIPEVTPLDPNSVFGKQEVQTTVSQLTGMSFLEPTLAPATPIPLPPTVNPNLNFVPKSSVIEDKIANDLRSIQTTSTTERMFTDHNTFERFNNLNNTNFEINRPFELFQPAETVTPFIQPDISSNRLLVDSIITNQQPIIQNNQIPDRQALAQMSSSLMNLFSPQDSQPIFGIPAAQHIVKLDTSSVFQPGGTNSGFHVGDTNAAFTTADTSAAFHLGNTNAAFLSGDTNAELPRVDSNAALQHLRNIIQTSQMFVPHLLQESMTKNSTDQIQSQIPITRSVTQSTTSFSTTAKPIQPTTVITQTHKINKRPQDKSISSVNVQQLFIPEVGFNDQDRNILISTKPPVFENAAFHQNMRSQDVKKIPPIEMLVSKDNQIRTPTVQPVRPLSTPKTDSVDSALTDKHISNDTVLCLSAHYVDGVAYVVLEDSCSEFLQCLQEGGKIASRKISCPFETFYDDLNQVCRHSNHYRCWRDPCYNREMMSYKHSGNNCRAYWACANTDSVPQCCPPTTSFLPGVGCVRNLTCSDSCMDFGDLNRITAASDCKNLVLEEDPSFYFEKVAGMGWMVRRCLPDNVFDQGLCRCKPKSDSLSEHCKPELYLDFQGSVEDKSGNSIYMGNVNVALYGDTGAFNGRAILQLWRFSGMSLGQHVTIRFRFRVSVTAKKGRLMHIVSNCCTRCDNAPKPSLDIGIIPGDNGGIGVFSITTHDAGEIFMFVPYQDTVTGWNQLEFRYDGMKLHGRVNKQSAVKQAIGSIKEKQETLLIGACGLDGAFDGFLDEFKFYLCNP